LIFASFGFCELARPRRDHYHRYELATLTVRLEPEYGICDEIDETMMREAEKK
jgi:hypothetical protein